MLVLTYVSLNWALDFLIFSQLVAAGTALHAASMVTMAGAVEDAPLLHHWTKENGLAL